MIRITVLLVFLAIQTAGCCCACKRSHATEGLAAVPTGFTALFDGTSLTGWRGWTGDPSHQGPIDPPHMALAQAAADQRMRDHWHIHNGELYFDGKGDSLCTQKEFADFELMLDWKILPGGDSGIYLRGYPQVQIWNDPIGSGGLYNNKQNPSVPLARADHQPGQWNSFIIRMISDRVTVHLNGVLVVDDVVMENMWDRSALVPQSGPIELQAHGTPLWFRNVWIRRLDDRHK